MKKIIYILFAILISMSCIFLLGGCDSCKGNSDNANAEVVLNAYMIELNVGDTFEFTVQKLVDGKELSVKDLQIKSDVEEIVSITNTTITALNTGATYIHFNVDGIKTACYVTVLEKETTNTEEAIICFSSKNLYNGLNSQVQAYVYDSNGYVVPEGIIWSIDGEGTVDGNGVVTPNAKQTTLVVKAWFIYKEKEYSISKSIDVLQPIYCIPSTNMVQLMVEKTPTGEAVEGIKSAEVSFNFKNFITDADEIVENISFTYKVSNDRVEVEIIDGKTAKIIAKNAGVSTVTFNVNGFVVFVDCKVAIPISTAEEFLSLQNSKLNSNNIYALVNDIAINVNGTYNVSIGEDGYDVNKGIEADSHACWKKDIDGTYCLMTSFNASLNGNGYKVSIINEITPFDAPNSSSFAGVFNSIKVGAVIENVVFDIQIKKSEDFISKSFSALAYKLEGTLRNCYIKTVINGGNIGDNSAVVRTITTKATLSNNIYEMDGSLATVSRDMKFSEYDEKQIIIGASQAMFTIEDNRFHSKLDNAVYYNSILDLLTVSNFGKRYIALYKVNTSDGGHTALEDATGLKAEYYHLEELTNGDDKLELDGNWTFDYDNGELKLCGRFVVSVG